jgi:hypothetical protein
MLELDGALLAFLAFSLSFPLALVSIVFGYYVVVALMSRTSHKDSQEVTKVTTKALDVLRETLGTLASFRFRR